MTEKDLMIITVKLNKDYEFNLSTELKIDKVNLNEELMKHPSKVAWFSVLYSLAVEKRDTIGTELDVVYAELDKDIRKDPKKYGIMEKVTEGAIVNTINSNEIYLTKKKEMIEAKRDSDVLGSAVRAFEHRKDMLVSLCANMRQEFGADNLSIKQQIVGTGQK